MSGDIREEILERVDDLVADFLYYSRKEDEDLPQGTIEEAIRSGDIMMYEIAVRFHQALINGVYCDT